MCFADSDPAQQAAVPVEDSGSKSALPLQLERVPHCAWSRRYPLALLRWLAELLVRGEELLTKLLTKLLTNCLDELEPWLKWKVYDRRPCSNPNPNRALEPFNPNPCPNPSPNPSPNTTVCRALTLTLRKFWTEGRVIFSTHTRYLHPTQVRKFANLDG